MKHFYAATLLGDDPAAVFGVFSFKYQSQRKQWVSEKGIYPRVCLSSKIARKHTVMDVDFQNMNGRWSWVYEGIRAHWVAV